MLSLLCALVQPLTTLLSSRIISSASLEMHSLWSHSCSRFWFSPLGPVRNMHFKKFPQGIQISLCGYHTLNWVLFNSMLEWSTEGRDSNSHSGTSPQPASTGEGTEKAKPWSQGLGDAAERGWVWALFRPSPASGAQEQCREGLAAFAESTSGLKLGMQ